MESWINTFGKPKSTQQQIEENLKQMAREIALLRKEIRLMREEMGVENGTKKNK